jgi:hypothetical protein
MSAPLAAKQDAEKGPTTPTIPQPRRDAALPMLRSRLEHILNVAQRLRLRRVFRLRPCWRAFLSILRVPLFVEDGCHRQEGSSLFTLND